MHISALSCSWHGFMFFRIAPQNWHWFGWDIVLSAGPDSKDGVISMMSSGKIVCDFPSESLIFFCPVMRDVSEVTPFSVHNDSRIGRWLSSPFESWISFWLRYRPCRADQSSTPLRRRLLLCGL